MPDAFRRSVTLWLDFESYIEDGVWVARCHQLDILTSDPSKERAEQGIVKLAQAQVEYAMKNGLHMSLFRESPDPRVCGREAR